VNSVNNVPSNFTVSYIDYLTELARAHTKINGFTVWLVGTW